MLPGAKLAEDGIALEAGEGEAVNAMAESAVEAVVGVISMAGKEEEATWASCLAALISLPRGNEPASPQSCDEPPSLTVIHPVNKLMLKTRLPDVLNIPLHDTEGGGVR